MIIDILGGLPDHPNLDDAGIRWEDGRIVGHPLGVAALRREAEKGLEEGATPEDRWADRDGFLTLARRAFVNPEIYVDFLPLDEWLSLGEED